MAEKHQRVAAMGMESLLADASQQRQRLQAQYLEAEQAAEAHLRSIEGLKAAVRAFGSSGEEATPAQPSSELEELFDAIDTIGAELASLSRPQGLPPPGTQLPQPAPDVRLLRLEGSSCFWV